MSASCSPAGLLFGLDIGVIAGALPFIAKDFNVTSHQQEWIVSSMMFGAAIGAIGSGWMSSRLGRKEPDGWRGPVCYRVALVGDGAEPEMLIAARVVLGGRRRRLLYRAALPV